jgi:hypothetical protein
MLPILTSIVDLYRFVQALEQIFFLFFFVGLAWGWVVIAGLCVNATRTGNYSRSRLEANQAKYAYLQQTDPTQYGRRIIYEGSYIEAGPAVVCAAFLGVGVAFYVSTSVRLDLAKSCLTRVYRSLIGLAEDSHPTFAFHVCPGFRVCANGCVFDHHALVPIQLPHFVGLRYQNSLYTSLAS